MVTQTAARRLWLFVPILYFMQAVPVTIVQEVSTFIYKDLGFANVAITRWTSLLALPWTMKLLWAPLVDVNFTKRGWVIAVQGLITVVLAILPFALAMPNAFALSLGVFAIVGLLSSTCDIATDGFYLLTLNREEQSAYVGVQSAMYKLGRLFCVGLLVFLAGVFQKDIGAGKVASWTYVLLGAAGVYCLGWIVLGIIPGCRFGLPSSPLDIPRDQNETNENRRNLLRTLSIVVLALFGYFLLNSVVRLLAHSAWLFFGATGALAGWKLTIDQLDQEFVQLPICAAGALASFLAARRLIRGTRMADAFGSFLRQRGIGAVLAFILFFRFGEAMVSKMTPLFLKDSLAVGGMGLSDKQAGPIVGIAGVIGIICGGILGGLIVSKWGLRKSFWPLVVAMHLPNLLYLWTALVHPPVYALYGVSFVEPIRLWYWLCRIFGLFDDRRPTRRLSHLALRFRYRVGCVRDYARRDIEWHSSVSTGVGLCGLILVCRFCYDPWDADAAFYTNGQRDLSLVAHRATPPANRQHEVATET